MTPLSHSTATPFRVVLIFVSLTLSGIRAMVRARGDQPIARSSMGARIPTTIHPVV
jgi:hypothetical protein